MNYTPACFMSTHGFQLEALIWMLYTEINPIHMLLERHKTRHEQQNDSQLFQYWNMIII